MTTAVLDAGPLIHLAEIDSLHLLTIFGALHMPGAVWAETVEQGGIDPTDIEVRGNVRREAVAESALQTFSRRPDVGDLHRGERACLYVCQERNIGTLLTDDLAVRHAARRLGITPVGSLGIVVRAYRLGRLTLSDAELRLEALYDVSSLYVTRAIVELAITQLRQSTGGRT